MELSIEQALRQGMAAHKEGKIKDAERLYRAILKSQPTHPDANHNLGVLAVSVNKAEAALPFFKTALESNPKIEQFWLSYIDALVKEKQFENAKELLEQGKNQGFDGEALNALEAQLSLITQKTNPGNAGPSQQQLSELNKYYQKGRHDDAEKLATSITEQFPNHQVGWKVLGALFAQKGMKDEALNANQRAIPLAPQDSEVHNNLGITFKALGRLGEAEVSLRQAIALKPDFAEAHSNLGNTLNELGRLDEAEIILRHAMALKSDYAEAYNNLGNTLQALGRLDEAETSLRQAIALKPDYAEAHNNLAIVLNKLGRLDEAVTSCIGALKIKPDLVAGYYSLGTLLANTSQLKSSPDLIHFVSLLLEKKTIIRPNTVVSSLTNLLKHDPIIQSALTSYSLGELKLDETITGLFKVPFLLKLMTLCPISDLEIEGLLKGIRHSILFNVSTIQNNNEVLAFQIALALQCFTNEYIYDETVEEIEAVGELEKLIGRKLTNDQIPSVTELACLASYKSLYECSWCVSFPAPEGLEEIWRRQIQEPEKEKRLNSEISKLTEITDTISTKVKEQYEENPYPRWVNLGLPQMPLSISKLTNQLNLKITSPLIKHTSQPQILVAGCGTGQHSIEVACKYRDCKVLAIDLSLRSLAYAKRKTEELGIENIEYVQADILELEKLSRQFDIIESSGVLHHMADPISGWKVLVECLKPTGLMNIGLYSELARMHIIQVQKEINRLDLTSDRSSIKSFRNDLIQSNEERHKKISSVADFYSVSEIRDLLFHPKEHRFTISKIKDALEYLGLSFCGFQSDNIIRRFKAKNSGLNDLYDLNLWNEFEASQPDAFIAMYQFWCQKNQGVIGKELSGLEAQLSPLTQKASPSSTSPSQQQLSELIECYQKGRHDDAEKLAISITEQFPNHQTSWKILGALFIQKGMKDEALSANQRAVHLAPQDAEAHNNLGNTFNEMGRLSEAEASLRQALALKSDFPEAYSNLGNTFQALGRLSEAEASLGQAIALKSDYAEAHNNLGNTLNELGRLDEAEASMRQAIALKSDYAEAYNNLGNTLQAQGRLDEAEAFLRQAIELNPDFSEAHNSLGNTLQALGKLDEAETSVRQAIALKPDFAEAHNNLGVIRNELGRLDEAEVSLRQAIELRPDFVEALWNLSGMERTIQGAEHWVGKCLMVDANHVPAKLTKAALRFYQGDRDDFDNLMKSEFKQHSYMRSFSWVFSLPNLPDLYFNRWHFFDAIVKQSIRSRPFYEFGVWRGEAFKYLIKSFKKGYGFDTFSGLPEDWRVGNRTEPSGSYTSDGNIPDIKGGEFIVGKFEDTLPIFYSESRPIASVINFDADLYSSTLCALNYSNPVMDKHTVLIFDEFIIHESWEQDEFKALTEFASINNYTFEVIAISFFTKQVAVKLIGI
ncbi:MAG: hypothetical protein CL568_00900 [Alphaproteobacteria bacterium]|nr:hypothetical protein [Alphaproteobacteria bacterium]PPR13570.1 MAG: Lipopolysaccharide assembly protein B [Alphaproteobacteria bacterium MarineAlpha12_Bin1]|tara:strand:+ start:748 stop:4980 length:4233 start_codon:yes stop_codon:yes gene_type:complete